MGEGEEIKEGEEREKDRRRGEKGRRRGEGEWGIGWRKGRGGRREGGREAQMISFPLSCSSINLPQL